MRRVAMLAALGVLVSLLLVPNTAAAVVRRTISANLSPSAVYVGAPITVSGRVTRSAKGTIVLIERKVGMTWKVAAGTRTTNRYGNYVVRYLKESTAGVFVYRARVQKTSTKSAAVSPVRSVTTTWRRGTFQNPWSVLEQVNVPGWTVRMFPADYDAWPVIQPVNPYNTAPGPGSSYVMAQVQFTRTGSTAADPVDGLGFQFVSKTDQTYWGGRCGVIPASWFQIGTMQPGETVTANVCSDVPSSYILGGLWRIYTASIIGYARSS